MPYGQELKQSIWKPNKFGGGHNLNVYGPAGTYTSAMERIRSSPMTAGVQNVAGQIAAKPVSIDDATKQRMVGVQSDEAVHGYGQSRQRLRSALAAAGALDSPAGMAKEVGMSNTLSAQMQGIRRGGEITQARTNLSDQLRSLSGLSGAQQAMAGQEFVGARMGDVGREFTPRPGSLSERWKRWGYR